MKSTAKTIDKHASKGMFWLVKTGANVGQSEQTLGLQESANPNNTCSMNALQTIVPSGSLIFLARAGS